MFVGAKIDFRYWMQKYEEDYSKDVDGKWPIFIDEKGIEHEERSPYFETISRVLQKRGYLLKKEFVRIGKWKTERQTKSYETNTDNKVKNLTKEALKAPDTKKIQILNRLRGVGVPVASAILTIVYPTEYCVIDYRTWRALLWLRAMATKDRLTFASYKDYSDLLDQYDTYGGVHVYYSFRNALKKIGEKRNMTPRQVEMALWKFDEMKGECSENIDGG